MPLDTILERKNEPVKRYFNGFLHIDIYLVPDRESFVVSTGTTMLVSFFHSIWTTIMVEMNNDTFTAVISQWFGRIVVTVMLALMWHWYNLPVQEAVVDTGKRLMDIDDDKDRRLNRLQFWEEQLQLQRDAAAAATAVDSSPPAEEERNEIKDEIFEQGTEPRIAISEPPFEAPTIAKDG